LVKVEGHTLEGAKKALKNGEVEITQPELNKKELIERLEGIKEKLRAMR
jgi:hypothetical protein